MVEAETAAPIAPPARKWVLMFVGLAGGVMSLTLLFLAMRAVMEVGGSCASGNTPYAFTAIGVNLVALAWPALFLSLGWNFLVYGIDPPLGDSPAWGWLVCAVVFGLMGGVPLVIAISAFRDGRASRWRASQPRAAWAAGSGRSTRSGRDTSCASRSPCSSPRWWWASGSGSGSSSGRPTPASASASADAARSDPAPGDLREVDQRILAMHRPDARLRREEDALHVEQHLALEHRHGIEPLVVIGLAELGHLLDRG